jgi:putative NIF3 family GTP cyclohydrolase 1 type 2
MDLLPFNQTIDELVSKELLKQFADDYRLTFIAGKPISRIEYAVNLSLEVIEQAARNRVDLILIHHLNRELFKGSRFFV